MVDSVWRMYATRLRPSLKNSRSMTITLQNDILGIPTDEQDEAVKTTCQISGERRQRLLKDI